MLETELGVEIGEVIRGMVLNSRERMAVDGRLPEIIHRANHLYWKLQEGEYFTPEIEDLDLGGKVRQNVGAMVLYFHGIREKPVKTLILTSSGTIVLPDPNLFLDYKPLPEPQRS